MDKEKRKTSSEKPGVILAIEINRQRDKVETDKTKGSGKGGMCFMFSTGIKFTPKTRFYWKFEIGFNFSIFALFCVRLHDESGDLWPWSLCMDTRNRRLVQTDPNRQQLFSIFQIFGQLIIGNCPLVVLRFCIFQNELKEKPKNLLQNYDNLNDR